MAIGITPLCRPCCLHITVALEVKKRVIVVNSIKTIKNNETIDND